jgi:hypothetical protein
VDQWLQESSLDEQFAFSKGGTRQMMFLLHSIANVLPQQLTTDIVKCAIAILGVLRTYFSCVTYFSLDLEDLLLESTLGFIFEAENMLAIRNIDIDVRILDILQSLAWKSTLFETAIVSSGLIRICLRLVKTNSCQRIIAVCNCLFMLMNIDEDTVVTTSSMPEFSNLFYVLSKKTFVSDLSDEEIAAFSTTSGVGTAAGAGAAASGSSTDPSPPVSELKVLDGTSFTQWEAQTSVAELLAAFFWNIQHVRRHAQRNPTTLRVLVRCRMLNTANYKSISQMLFSFFDSDQVKAEMDRVVRVATSFLIPVSKGDMAQLALRRSDEEPCVICMDNDDTTKPFVLTACGHLFHTDCLATSLNFNSACPVCRFVVTKSIYDSIAVVASTAKSAWNQDTPQHPDIRLFYGRDRQNSDSGQEDNDEDDAQAPERKHQRVLTSPET